MSDKRLLKFGIPTLGVLLIIIGIALFAGRDPRSPELTNPDETIIEFQGFKYSKQELYDKMKANYGLNTVLNELDYFLLKDYENKIDEEKINEDIADQKEQIGEDEFYDQFVSLGIFLEDGEDQDDLDQKIFDFYKLQEIKRAYARDQIEIKEADVQKKFDEYREDVCVIPLTFPNKSSYEAFYELLEDKSDEDIINEFVNEYNKQQADKDENDEDEDEDEVELLDPKFECQYERVVYSEAKANYRNFVFNDLVAYTKLEEGEELAGNSYNSTIKVIDGKYYIVFKYDEANAKENNRDELWNQVEEELITATLTNTYITNQVQKLREDTDLVIYDPVIADQYNEVVAEKHKVFKKSKRNNQVVAEIEGLIIKADDLYEELKATYGVSTIIDKVNYLALNSIKDIRPTKNEISKLEKQIEEIRQSFLQSGYGQFFTWNEYINALYGASSRDELLEIFTYQSYLIERYILGYKGHPGSNPIESTEVVEKFDIWLNAKQQDDTVKSYRSITASHILFKFDDFDEDDNPTEETRDRALKLADQIIYGVNDDNRIEYDEENEDNPNILFKYNLDNEDAELEEFRGLRHLPDGYKLADVFKQLAKDYSDDTSASNGGDLGKFGPTEFRQTQQGQQIPVRMVEPFEQAALKTQEGDWLDEPVETEFGIHIIFVTKKEEAPKMPEDYLELSIEEIEEKIKDKEPLYKEYHDFFTILRNQVKEERLATDAVDRELALLRNEKNFKFNDPVIQKHYEAMQAIYLRNNEDSEE